MHAQEVSPYTQTVTVRCTMVNQIYHTDQSAAHVYKVTSIGPLLLLNYTFGVHELSDIAHHISPRESVNIISTTVTHAPQHVFHIRKPYPSYTRTKEVQEKPSSTFSSHRP